MEGQSDNIKEITIRFHPKYIKWGAYITLIVLLILVILFQQFGVIPTSDSIWNKSNVETKTSKVVGPINDSELEVEVELEEETVVENTTNTTKTEEEEEETTTETDDNEDLLPITGDVTITIDKITTQDKTTWAKVLSVKFTIKNQNGDFIPTVKGYIVGEEEDDKEVTYSELESGKTMTKTETGLFFSYTDRDETKTLRLDVYDEDNAKLTTVTKTFSAA